MLIEIFNETDRNISLVGLILKISDLHTHFERTNNVDFKSFALPNCSFSRLSFQLNSNENYVWDIM